MMLTLQRLQSGSDGIFGRLSGDGLDLRTLEHAYDDGHGSWAPKLPAGTYTCVRGEHQLAHMTQPFTTFEVTGIPGHTGILFHVGNFNRDSEGCVLLGLYSVDQHPPMLIGSMQAFTKFMHALEGADTFQLSVL